MPTYNFLNKETQEVTEVFLKISEIDKYKEDNPQLEQCHITAVPIGDPVRLGIRKQSGDFREIMQHIHKGTAGSVLNKNMR
jgi:hypothetical protein